jgi:hypothetical protein
VPSISFVARERYRDVERGSDRRFGDQDAGFGGQRYAKRSRNLAYGPSFGPAKLWEAIRDRGCTFRNSKPDIVAAAL